MDKEKTQINPNQMAIPLAAGMRIAHVGSAGGVSGPEAGNSGAAT